MTSKKLRDKILSEYKKGNIVIMSKEGVMTTKLENILDQPIDGILYDLNRNEVVILAFIEDPKWVNDFALVKLLRHLYEQNQDLIKHREENAKTISGQWNQIEELEIKLKDSNVLLDKYDIRKFAMWMCKHGYCDTDIYSEDGIEEYLKEIE